MPDEVNPAPIVLAPKPVVSFSGKVTFFDEGEQAGFRIGNSELRLSYEDALRFSQMLRVHAKRAKRTAGDVSRHWSAIGVLNEEGR